MTSFSPLPWQRLLVGHGNFARSQSLRSCTQATIAPKLQAKQLRRLLGKFAQKRNFSRKNPSLADVAMATGGTKIWKLDTMIHIVTAYNLQPCIVIESLIRRPLLSKNDEFQTKSAFRSDSPILSHISHTIKARKILTRCHDNGCWQDTETACWQSFRCCIYATITPRRYLQQLRRLLQKFAQKTGFQAKNSRLAAVATTGRTNIWKLDTMVDIMTAYNGQPCIVPVSLTRSRC